MGFAKDFCSFSCKSMFLKFDNVMELPFEASLSFFIAYELLQCRIPSCGLVGVILVFCIWLGNEVNSAFNFS